MADWSRIESLPSDRLEALFAADPDRLKRLSLDVAGIHFDWSKTHLTGEAIDAFEALAKQMDLSGRREAMFAGEHVNETEDRPVEHTAERGEGKADSVARAASYHARMRAVIDAIEADAFGPVRHVLHVGIGGSALGPHLLVDALGRDSERYDVAIVSNVDGMALDDVFDRFDPAATLLVVSRLSTPVTPVAPTTTPPPSEASTPRRSNAPRGRANAHAAFEPLVPTSIMRLNGAATSLAFTNSGGVVGGSVEGDVQGVVLTNGPLPTPRFSMDDAIVDVVTCQHPEHGDLVFTLDESGRILTRHWPTGTVQDDIEDACTSAPSMSISLDGGMIAIACTDFQAQIMDIETLTDRRVRSSRGAIQTVSVTDSGDRLAGGTAGGQVYVWDTADGGLLSSIEASDVAISKVAWSSDGSMISALDASGECFVWDWDNSAGSATSLHQFRASSEDGVAASFDASGAWLVCVADGEVIVFDVQAGTESARRVVDAGGVESIAIDEDGRRVAYGTESGVVWFVVLPIQVEPVDLP